MFKNISKIILSILTFVLSFGVIRAVVDTVSIQSLPTYINYDNFRLSYAAASDNPVSVLFSVKKDGDSTWKDFGGTISGNNGYVDVGGSQFYDGDGLYEFRVLLNGGTASDTTSVRLDRGGPSPVSEYSKQDMGGGHYKLSWRTPSDSDFDKVLIYRSTETKFDANGSTRVGELGGSPNVVYSWEDFGLDANKTYYYALRAFDYAGNASSIVSDIPSTTQETVITEEVGEVQLLPGEEGASQADGEGEVLGEEEEGLEGEEMDEEMTAGDKSIFEKVVQFAKDRTKITVGIIFGLGVIIYGVYWYFGKQRGEK